MVRLVECAFSSSVSLCLADLPRGRVHHPPLPPSAGFEPAAVAAVYRVVQNPETRYLILQELGTIELWSAGALGEGVSERDLYPHCCLHPSGQTR